MRDPNQVNNKSPDQWLKATLIGLKKLSEPPSSPPATQPQSDASKITGEENNISTLIQKDDKAVVTKTLRQESKKDEPQKAESLGVVDATGKQTVHGIYNTQKFRYRFSKQLRPDVGKSNQRDAIIKSVLGGASRSGRMSVKALKRAIYAVKLPRSQERRLLKNLGV